LNVNLIHCALCNQGFLETEIAIPATKLPKTYVGTTKKRKKNMPEDVAIGSSSYG
jgi:hypothetical protein